jgi:hypothetical protein
MWRVRRRDELVAGFGRSGFARVWRSESASGGRMSGRRSRSKGARIERSTVNALNASGIAAVRVPLSGAVSGRFGGYIVLPLLSRELCIEVKARTEGNCELLCWLSERDLLIVKANRQEPLVVVRLFLAAGIVKLGAPAPVFDIAQTVENSVDVGAPGP